MVKSILIKKSQVWGFDLVIALIIFLVGIIAVYVYAINFLSEAQDTIEELSYEGNLASSIILSEGTPNSWTITNVENPGILSNNKINQTKLDAFYYLTTANHTYTKKLLGIKNEFYFNFTGLKIDGNPIGGIGKQIENPKNLIKLERFSIYEDKPIKFNFYIWN